MNAELRQHADEAQRLLAARSSGNLELYKHELKRVVETLMAGVEVTPANQAAAQRVVTALDACVQLADGAVSVAAHELDVPRDVLLDALDTAIDTQLEREDA